MYELFVLACLVGNPDKCVTLKDLHSPHNTHDKCLARAYVIAQEIPSYLPQYFPKSYKCFDKKEEKGKLNI
jgi:hypothetical protein